MANHCEGALQKKADSASRTKSAHYAKPSRRERVGVRGFEPIERAYPLTPPLSPWEREPSEFAALAHARLNEFKYE
jgi:hypothetical protein